CAHRGVFFARDGAGRSQPLDSFGIHSPRVYTGREECTIFGKTAFDNSLLPLSVGDGFGSALLAQGRRSRLRNLPKVEKLEERTVGPREGGKPCRRTIRPAHSRVLPQWSAAFWRTRRSWSGKR